MEAQEFCVKCKRKLFIHALFLSYVEPIFTRTSVYMLLLISLVKPGAALRFYLFFSIYLNYKFQRIFKLELGEIYRLKIDYMYYETNTAVDFSPNFLHKMCYILFTREINLQLKIIQLSHNGKLFIAKQRSII